AAAGRRSRYRADRAGPGRLRRGHAHAGVAKRRGPAPAPARIASFHPALAARCDRRCRPLALRMPAPLINPPLPASAKQRRYWVTPHGSSMALAVVDAAQAHDGLVVVVARDNLRARLLEDELAVFAGSLP